MAKTRHLSNKPRATKKRSQKKRSQRKRARTGKKRGGYFTREDAPAAFGSSYKPPTLIQQALGDLVDGVINVTAAALAGGVLYTVYLGGRTIYEVTQATGITGGKSSGIKGGSTDDVEPLDVDVTGLMKFLQGKSPEEIKKLIETGGDLIGSFKKSPEQFTDIIQKFKKDMTQEEFVELQNILKNLSKDVIIELHSDIGEVMKN